MYVCVFIFHFLLRWRVRDTAENQENKAVDTKKDWVRPTKNPENIFLDSLQTTIVKSQSQVMFWFLVQHFPFNYWAKEFPRTGRKMSGICLEILTMKNCLDGPWAYWNIILPYPIKYLCDTNYLACVSLFWEVTYILHFA